MFNPDPMTYASWAEFAKQLFWDYQLGEAFVLPMGSYANGLPMNFRVIPPWLMNVELKMWVNPATGGQQHRRVYSLGNLDVTDEILHIRNISSTIDARGHCALEAAGGRMVTAGLLERYARNLAETGGVPHSWLDVPGRKLTHTEATDLLDQWVESRARHAGGPGILSGGVDLKQAQTMSAKDLALLELSQFNESRICVLLGVPPFLVALPMSQGESITYSNASTIFDYHDRSSLRPKAVTVMSALSGWLLPRGQSIELNRDDYSRPGYLERAQANQIYIETGVLQAPEVRAMERFDGVPSATAALTGAETIGNPVQQAPEPSPGDIVKEDAHGF
jgi:HK97 family phage portal protein